MRTSWAPGAKVGWWFLSARESLVASRRPAGRTPWLQVLDAALQLEQVLLVALLRGVCARRLGETVDFELDFLSRTRQRKKDEQRDFESRGLTLDEVHSPHDAPDPADHEDCRAELE